MEKTEKLIHEGNIYLNELEFEEALKLFKSAIKLDSKNHHAYLGKADALIGILNVTGEGKVNSNEITEAFEKAIELSPEEDPFYYARYGEFCLGEMRFKKAEECYRKAAELDEVNARIYFTEFANEYVFMENIRKEIKGRRKVRIYKKALGYFFKAIDLSPEGAQEIITAMLEEGPEDEGAEGEGSEK